MLAEMHLGLRLSAAFGLDGNPDKMGRGARSEQGDGQRRKQPPATVHEKGPRVRERDNVR
jgi:hypothetical protein